MKYKHLEQKHNMLAPSIIVPLVYKEVMPKSVVDVGCGLGTFLKGFKDLGVDEVLGIDGPWVNRQLLLKHIDENEFQEADLERPIVSNKKFDLAISLEVAEHLSERRADGFVDDLARLSDHILFSAAIPGQGGDHHINEQWIGYWKVKFERNGFVMLDILRPQLWENNEVFWWYRQNMFMFVREHSRLHHVFQGNGATVLNVVHPELFQTWTNYRDRNAIKRYARVLYKAIAYRLGLVK